MEKCACQGDLISAYLFMIVSGTLFGLTTSQSLKKGIEIFDDCILFMAYADYSTFFLKDIALVKNLVGIFQTFSLFSGLKPNI